MFASGREAAIACSISESKRGLSSGSFCRVGLEPSPKRTRVNILILETIGESVGLSVADCLQCSGKLLGRPIGYCRSEDDR